ncbi:MAG: hypothetical protein ACFFBD_05655 [Candidatus Hodarchaeota archaeon]
MVSLSFKLPQEKNLGALIFSSCLLVAGILGVGALQLVSYSLIPGYGGGETFSLVASTNYTAHFPSVGKLRLHATITANDTLEVYLDEQNIYNGSHYTLILEPGQVLTLKAKVPVAGRIIFRQEVPILTQLAVFSLLTIGLITTALSLVFWVRSMKN